MKRLVAFICIFTLIVVIGLADKTEALLVQYGDRGTFEAQAATIDYNYGYEDFGSDVSLPGDPWTSHGVTYNSGDNLIIGTDTVYKPISNVYSNNGWSAILADIDTSPQYDMFALDLGYLIPLSSIITFEVSTNLDTYVFSGLSVPLASTSMDFYGFIAGTGEFFTGFRLVSSDGTISPVIDNVTLGHVNNVVPEPATMFLLGSGVLGLAVFGKKKRSK